MRYFYYGTEKRKESMSSGRQMEYGSKVRKEDDLVIEEDTIYEIDRECEACRQRIMKGRWLSYDEKGQKATRKGGLTVGIRTG